MTERPKIPVVVRRKAAETPVAKPVEAPREVEPLRRRSPYGPNAIVAPRFEAPRSPNPTPSRPIMREAPIAVNTRTFGSGKPKDRDRDSRRSGTHKVGRAERSKEPVPPTPPAPRAPRKVVELSELSFKTLRVVVAMTARNAALPQATTDAEFVAGATYRDIRRELAVTWPEVREAVQDLRVHSVLQVARFFGRFGPVFILSEYGSAILEALDAGKPLPEPPSEVRVAIEAAKAAYDAWASENPSNDQPRLKRASEG